MAWNTIREKKSEVKGMTANKVVDVHPSAKASDENLKGGSSKHRDKDLAAGMEILDLDFLLSIVENIDSNDKSDVAMRRLIFNELLRREQQDTIDSNALKVYAMNDGKLYSKVIQFEALKVLTERTSRKSKQDG